MSSTTEVRISVEVSLRVPNGMPVHDVRDRMTATLFATVSLMTCENGMCYSTPAPDLLIAPKIFDTIHSTPIAFTESEVFDSTDYLTLGHLKFTGLIIRQAGSYHIRVTLIDTMGPFQSWARTVAIVDSELVKVGAESSGDGH